MNASALVCSFVAASLGLGSVSAFAQPAWRGDGHGDQRFERRAERQEQRQQRQDWRAQAQQRVQPAPMVRQAQPVYQQQAIPAPAREPNWQGRAYTHNQPHYQARQPYYQQQPQYQYQPRYQSQYQPRYQYRNAPYYAPHYAYGGGQRYYYVGDRLPYDDWRGMRVVNDWPVYSLSAPPYGYQWVQADTGEFLLVALATGLIASLLLSR